MNNTVHKKEFVSMVAKKVKGKCPYRYVYYVVQAVFACFEDILKEGDSLYVADCFRMEPRYRKEKRVGNFGNDPVVVPGHYEAYFRPFKKLRNACRELDKKMEIDHEEINGKDDNINED